MVGIQYWRIRNRDRDVGHEINCGDDDGKLVIQPTMTSLGQLQQVSRGSESEFDEKIDLAAAGNTDIGKCGI